MYNGNNKGRPVPALRRGGGRGDKSMTILEASDAESLCEIVVTEGKYHQVKRMFGALGHPVLALRRQSVAGIELDAALAPGGWRELTAEEKGHLYAVTELEE